MYPTVAAAVEGMEKQPFYLKPITFPGPYAGTFHLSISDPSGDLAIIEYINGKLDFSKGAPTLKLDLLHDPSEDGADAPACNKEVCVGEANASLRPAEPYQFMSPMPNDTVNDPNCVEP